MLCRNKFRSQTLPLGSETAIGARHTPRNFHTCNPFRVSQHDLSWQASALRSKSGVSVGLIEFAVLLLPGCLQVRRRVQNRDEKFKDHLGTWEAALNPGERSRLDDFRKAKPHCCWDLANGLQRPIFSECKGPLHTLKRGMGVNWRGDLEPRRWLTGPATEATTQAIGEPCPFFTPGWSKPPTTRSRSSMVHQIGNAMHINAVGSVAFAVFWLDGPVLSLNLDGGNDVMTNLSLMRSTTLPRTLLSKSDADKSHKIMERMRALKRKMSDVPPSQGD